MKIVFTITMFILFLCGCQNYREPYNEYEMQIRSLPINGQNRMVIKKDWEKMDSMTFLRLKNVEQVLFYETDTLPPWLHRYPKLGYILISNIPVRNLPQNIESISSLTALWINNTKIKSISEISGLTKLESLTCVNSALSFIPDNMNQLKNLRFISLDENQIQYIPETICQIIELEYLNLDNNKIQSLPLCIGNLRVLEKLSIYNNQLHDIPESIYDLPKLKFIDLRGNPLKSPAEVKRRFKEKGVRCVVDLPE